ncbi:hypothetical protein MJO29_010614 [Puccinia striiformis f. sp. tritici]|uniref:Uncharacterized protein n=2 Tax=Puccinia striiformis TaxID=27350 RepID=A0A0L0UXS3_9BASI|nr:hypothetical protein Pst134EB_033047 [Puccinia striiformis f. sp. tritici]KAI7948949.1 hypothetical protein MJO29_010614 [Puccinia striiformis f. sp. tritici]KAI9610435.1 hypothetical protein H4Q26_006575 [Puccinia striiformis f. sp. tritici PST-130]KNE91848.1 hypothetical protein PSTG_14753 [Puccinia striiformis f. sp. tritici PST-78]POW19583.1 hypothetical protein PSHT_04490 [Puccinia striiformis]
MSDHKFFYYLAYLIAAPISALIIGVCLNHAYGSGHVSANFRWGNNAVAFLALSFIVIVFRENYAGIMPLEGHKDVLRISERPSAAQVLTPANVGSVQFLIQVYHIQQLFKGFGKTVWTIGSLVICGINFLTSWGCTVTILIKLSNPSVKVIDLSKSDLPTFQLDSQILTAWLATCLLTELVIVGGNLYSRRGEYFLEDKPIRFLRYDHLLTKIGVVALQTSAFNALIILTASIIFLVNLLIGDNPSPATTGCFILLNLMRVPVGYASLVFSLIRERNLSLNAIQQSLIASPNGSLKDYSVEDGKGNPLTNQVTVHTVTSQVFEN